MKLLKKMMKATIKEECNKAFRRGFKEGEAAGLEMINIAYENEIDCLKKQLDWAINRIAELAWKSTGDEI